MELNFEGLEMQKSLWVDEKIQVDDKNGVICLVIVFTSAVMVIKMSKTAHFLFLLLMAAKKQSQFGKNI